MNQERIAEIERLLKIAEDELSHVQKQRQFLLDQIASLKRGRENLPHLLVKESPAQYSGGYITSHSSEEAKVRLFRSFFRGREDVYARRFESRKTAKSGYQPDCRNEWLAGVCLKPKIKCSHCDQRQFIPLTDAVIRSHLMGRNPADPDGKDFTIGVYPLLPDETCWFLAVDFDKSAWKEDATAFRHTCELHGLPASLERSRSGNGAHVWIFFSEQNSPSRAPGAHPTMHENGVVYAHGPAMDEGRLYCDALSSRNSLTWSPIRTHDCCRLHGVEHAKQIVSFFGGLHCGSDWGIQLWRR